MPGVPACARTSVRNDGIPQAIGFDEAYAVLSDDWISKLSGPVLRAGRPEVTWPTDLR
jgi:hypothetical protein